MTSEQKVREITRALDKRGRYKYPSAEEHYQKLAENLWIIFSKLQEVGFDEDQAMRLTLVMVEKGN